MTLKAYYTYSNNSSNFIKTFFIHLLFPKISCFPCQNKTITKYNSLPHLHIVFFSYLFLLLPFLCHLKWVISQCRSSHLHLCDILENYFDILCISVSFGPMFFFFFFSARSLCVCVCFEVGGDDENKHDITFGLSHLLGESSLGRNHITFTNIFLLFF